MSKMLFVGGDLAGIQKFIYNISSKKAMVSLKGRSAFLKEYTQKVCERILNIPEVKTSQETDNIYCSGGKFYLQVPDSDIVRDRIDEVYCEVSKELWKEHNGQLSINIAYVSFEYTNNKRERVIVDGNEDTIGLLWKVLTEKFQNLKNQKFRDLLIDKYNDFFEVKKIGDKQKVCAITGVESEDCVKLVKDTDGDEIWILPSVKEQVQLGQQLRDKYHFKTLEEYAKGSYLGVLRMDVDGLGKVFIDGFPSMDEYKSFSRKLDAFFDAEKGSLYQIKKQDKYKDDMNIVYAGGDDIFAIGRWDVVIDFAAEVRNEFVEYIGKEGVSLSGGVAIVGGKFPIAKSAELAGEAEDKAKSYEYKDKKKNAFCFLGETVSWDEEFDYVLKYKKQFVSLINEYGLSRGILHKMMTYSEKAKESNSISFMWHTVYYLTRFIESNSKKMEIVSFCKDLRDKQLVKINNFRLIGLAARWAELDLRNKKINN
ncbi:MAG: hypothetical protein MJZ30_01685 [Paludibacteraceae bacterium]|nr:hypothetical protein [Paludibacteraceae bacterium]